VLVADVGARLALGCGTGLVGQPEEALDGVKANILFWPAFKARVGLPRQLEDVFSGHVFLLSHRHTGNSVNPVAKPRRKARSFT
jgi:hypothetical protein